MDNQNRTGTPGAEENELNKKQVFTDIHSSPESTPVLISDYDALPELDMHKKTILDEAYAEQKNDRETHMPKMPANKTPSVHHPRPAKRPTAKAQRARTVRFKDIRLCSGEYAADAVWRILREFGALAVFCAVVAAVFGIRGFVIDRMTNDDFSSLARSTTYSTVVALEEMNWVTADLPEGIAAAQTVCTNLSAPITDSKFIEKHTEKLIYPTVVSAGMASVLTEDHVELKTNMSNLDLLLQIHTSLENKNPVIVLFFDKKADTVRYGIVTHMDAEGDTVTVQSAGGNEHRFTFEQFIAATRFENAEELPFQIRAGLLFGSWGRNTAIFVK